MRRSRPGRSLGRTLRLGEGVEVTIWGARGSIPKPGPETVRHGGDTACVALRSKAGQLVVIDCGTGAHALGRALTAAGGPVGGALLISHMHWDHIQGLPFFAPLFRKGAVWDVYGPRGLGQPLRDTLAGQMRSAHFPVALEEMGAEIRFHELLEGAFAIGDLTVRTQYLDHPALTLGYRVEGDGAAVVYVSDHEPRARVGTPGPAELAGAERGHVDFLRGADLVIHDAQYTAQEYPDRIGWGHATGEYAMAVCAAAGAAALRLFHHDPWRDDEAVDAIVARLRAGARPGDPAVAAATVGETITLAGARGAAPAGPRGDALSAAPAAPTAARLALGPMRHDAAQTLREAAAAIGLPLAAAGDAGALRIADAAHAGDDAALVVTDDPAPAADGPARLRWPFSAQYAEARLRAALAGRPARWRRAAAPPDEPARLVAVAALDAAACERDGRFDRLTRMAAAAFDAPVAFVSIVGADAQRIVACAGAERQTTSREAAFCAHAILGDAPLVVPDALLDDRFADNPLVTGGPRLRFYAGCPLRAPGGDAVGTFCVVDMRPRDLAPRQRDLLADFAALAAQALTGTAA